MERKIVPSYQEDPAVHAPERFFFEPQQHHLQAYSNLPEVQLHDAPELRRSSADAPEAIGNDYGDAKHNNVNTYALMSKKEAEQDANAKPKTGSWWHRRSKIQKALVVGIPLLVVVVGAVVGGVLGSRSSASSSNQSSNSQFWFDVANYTVTCPLPNTSVACSTYTNITSTLTDTIRIPEAVSGSSQKILLSDGTTSSLTPAPQFLNSNVPVISAAVYYPYGKVGVTAVNNGTVVHASYGGLTFFQNGSFTASFDTPISGGTFYCSQISCSSLGTWTKTTAS